MDLKNLWERDLKNLNKVTPDIWDKFKAKCKSLMIFHSKRLNQIKFQKYKNLQSKFCKLSNLSKDNPGIYDKEITKCDIKLDNFYKNLNEGSKIRSRVKSLISLESGA